MPYSTYEKVGLLNQTWGATAFTPPVTFYMFLSTTDPGADGSTRTEPSGNGYAQLAITNNTVNWPAVVASPMVNGVDFAFNPATGAWGTIAYAGFLDQDGNYIAGGALYESKAIVAGDVLTFAAGSISIAVS